MNDQRVLIAEELTLEQADPSRHWKTSLLTTAVVAAIVLAVWAGTGKMDFVCGLLVFGTIIVVTTLWQSYFRWWAFLRELPRSVEVTKEGVLHIHWRLREYEENLRETHWFLGETRLDVRGYALKNSPAVVLLLSNTTMIAVGYTETTRQQWQEVLEKSPATRVRNLTLWRRRAWVTAALTLGPLTGGSIGYYLGWAVEWATGIQPFAEPNMVLGAATGFFLILATGGARHTPSLSAERLAMAATMLCSFTGIYVTAGLLAMGHSILIGLFSTGVNLVVALLGTWVTTSLWDTRYVEKKC